MVDGAVFLLILPPPEETIYFPQSYFSHVSENFHIHFGIGTILNVCTVLSFSLKNKYQTPKGGISVITDIFFFPILFYIPRVGRSGNSFFCSLREA